MVVSLLKVIIFEALSQRFTRKISSTVFFETAPHIGIKYLILYCVPKLTNAKLPVICSYKKIHSLLNTFIIPVFRSRSRIRIISVANYVIIIKMFHNITKIGAGAGVASTGRVSATLRIKFLSH
jgi:hypothetical protein